MEPLDILTVAELLRLHGDVLDELRFRQVLRSSNGPSGDYAELLFCRAFGWDIRNNSASGYDAADREGVRYQIKCRRLTPNNSSRQLSFMRRLPERPFDVLAGVLLDSAFLVQRAALVPFEVVQAKSTYVAHVNAWRLHLRDSIWEEPSVQDVTEQLRASQATI